MLKRLKERIRKWLLNRYEKNEKIKIAKVFNDRYTLRRPFGDKVVGSDIYGTPMKEGAWMCPTCNKIHLALKFNVFNGFVYPSCCSYPEGNRLGHRDVYSFPQRLTRDNT